MGMYDDDEKRKESSNSSVSDLLDSSRSLAKQLRSDDNAEKESLFNSPEHVPDQTGMSPSDIENISNGSGIPTNSGIYTGTGAETANAGTAASGAAGAGTGAAGTGAGAGAGTGTGAAGTAVGAGGGAAAGSVVPIVGTAIGAAAGEMAKDKAKAEAKKQAGHSLKEVSEEKVTKSAKDKLGKSNSAMTEDNNFIVKLIFGIIAALIAVVVIIVVLVMTVLLTIAGPAISLYTMIKDGITGGIERCDDFFSQFDSDEPSFEEICSVLIEDMKSAFLTAYNEICYQEVYQIAVEQEYDIALTMNSYQETEFPYTLDGDDCNINYAEILNILSMSDKINCSVDAFEYSAFKELLEDKEFLRCLYDLHVEPVNYLIIGLGEDESGSVDGEGIVTITNTKTNETRTYQGVKGVDYDTYGSVSVGKYPVKKIFDYFEVDPYAKNEVYKTMTNYNALGIINQTTRLYDRSVFWGSSYKGVLYDYEKYTGEITVSEINEYVKEYVAYMELTEPGEPMEIPLMLQGDERWRHDSDGSVVTLQESTPSKPSYISNRGCCITCMAMVCTYMTGIEVTPVDLVKCRVVTTGQTNKGIYGPLNRGVTAKAYGFKENILGKPTVELIDTICSELDQQHPVILKMNTAVYKNISYNPDNPPTHFILLTGWNAEEKCFYVNDPAGVKGYYGEKSQYGGTVPFEQIISNRNLFMEARSYSY